MHNSVLKEDHVHAGAPDALVVVAQEGVEALLQTLKRLHWLVHLGRIKVWLLRFFTCARREQTVINRHSQSVSTWIGEHLWPRVRLAKSRQSICQRQGPRCLCARRPSRHPRAWPRPGQTTLRPPAWWIGRRWRACTRASIAPAAAEKKYIKFSPQTRFNMSKTGGLEGSVKKEQSLMQITYRAKWKDSQKIRHERGTGQRRRSFTNSIKQDISQVYWLQGFCTLSFPHE